MITSRLAYRPSSIRLVLIVMLFILSAMTIGVALAHVATQIVPAEGSIGRGVALACGPAAQVVPAVAEDQPYVASYTRAEREQRQTARAIHGVHVKKVWRGRMYASAVALQSQPRLVVTTHGKVVEWR